MGGGGLGGEGVCVPDSVCASVPVCVCLCVRARTLICACMQAWSVCMRVCVRVKRGGGGRMLQAQAQRSTGQARCTCANMAHALHSPRAQHRIAIAAGPLTARCATAAAPARAAARARAGPPPQWCTPAPPTPAAPWRGRCPAAWAPAAKCRSGWKKRVHRPAGLQAFFKKGGGFTGLRGHRPAAKCRSRHKRRLGSCRGERLPCVQRHLRHGMATATARPRPRLNRTPSRPPAHTHPACRPTSTPRPPAAPLLPCWR